MHTHRTTRMIGRAAVVALLVAPFATASAQYRRDDSDRISTADARRDGDERRRELERQRDAERRLFTWRGVVDDDTRIYIRANGIQSDVVSGSRTRRAPRVDRDRSLPRRDGVVRVQLIEGRGRVQVIQQPSSRNNYTAIVRVKDAQSGADTYRLAAFFDPEDDDNRGGWGNSTGNGGVWGDAGSGQRVMRWRGSVDGDIRITLRGTNVGYSVASGDQPRGVSSSGSLPRREGLLTVSMNQGRGSVTVLQHPSSYNNYTAVIRVNDSPGSYGYYDFDILWR